MARILVTGSADGLGLMAAQLLASQGHGVVLHARSDGRAADALAGVPEAAAVVVGDLASIDGMRQVAEAANATGPFDAVIHNAAVSHREPRPIVTADGLCHVFAINALAPYLLTALIEMPRRLIYLSSSLHRDGNPDVDDLQWERRPWSGIQAYSDTKLFDTILAFAVARLRPDVRSNAVEPGWVATKMGGPGATDDLSLGPVTQSWLAVSEDADALVTGSYLYHQRPGETHRAAHDHGVQDRFLEHCAALTGTTMPGRASRAGQSPAPTAN